MAYLDYCQRVTRICAKNDVHLSKLEGVYTEL
jgi:hypothetical protein